MASSSKNSRLLVLVVLFATTCFSLSSAVNLPSALGSNGRKTLFEAAVGMFTNCDFQGPSTTQQANHPSVKLTPKAFSTKARNTPAPPAVGPAPGLFNLKPRNTPAPPAVGPAPGLFNLKPRNTRAPPAVGPAPGLFNLKPRNTPIPPHGPAPGSHTSTFVSRVSAEQQEREVNKGFNGRGATLIPAGF